MMSKGVSPCSKARSTASGLGPPTGSGKSQATEGDGAVGLRTAPSSISSGQPPSAATPSAADPPSLASLAAPSDGAVLGAREPSDTTVGRGRVAGMEDFRVVMQELQDLVDANDENAYDADDVGWGANSTWGAAYQTPHGGHKPMHQLIARDSSVSHAEEDH